ncbi:hypothetical protein BJ508DRAFT_313894 [Ascobolus immersus RN42]|uniref:Uncharacterized protein n=1 Tax=Ascobolus immersus RN42 TaxID=1160509 RepID=A0A3N4HH24_ASCIM|nr:hypothetical protein BJ508DRAFT_313894 [Ascobolus immersus RN42]
MDRQELYRKIREIWMDPKQQLPASKQHREEILTLSQKLRVSYAELEKVLVEFWKRGPAPILPPISTTTPSKGRSTLSPSPSFFRNPLSPQPLTEKARRIARPQTPASPSPTPTSTTSRRGSRTPATPKPTVDPEVVALKEKLRVFEETLHRERQETKKREEEQKTKDALQDQTNLDAAACITRLSEARKAADKKLQEEQEASNTVKAELQQVKTSLTEAENRLKDLSKNGSDNSKYLRDELDKASLNYANLYTRLDDAEAKHAEEVERLKNVHSRQLQEKEKQWAEERNGLQNQLKEKDEEISMLEGEVSMLEGEVKRAQDEGFEEITDLLADRAALEDEVEEMNKEVERLTEELAAGGGGKKRKRRATPGPNRNGSRAAAKVSKSELDGLLRPAAELLEIPVPAEKVEEEVDDDDSDEEVGEDGQLRKKKKKVMARIWISELPDTNMAPRGRQASTRDRNYVHVPKKRKTGN